MLLIDKINERKTEKQQEKKSFCWSAISDVDNNLVYIEVLKNGSKLCVSIYDFKKEVISQDAVADGYVYGSVVEDVVQALDRKGWKVDLTDFPVAQVEAGIDSKNSSVYIDDLMIDNRCHRVPYERKVLSVFEDLCLNLKCNKIKALPIKDMDFDKVDWSVDFKNPQMLANLRNQQHFTRSNYEQFLKDYNFKKTLLGGYVRGVTLNSHYNMNPDKFAVMYGDYDLDQVVSHVNDGKEM